MRIGRLAVLALVALVAAGCARRGYDGGAFAYAAPQDVYILDSGDRLRVSVYGQDALALSTQVDAGGFVSLSLIGPVAARGLTTQGLAEAIAARLREGYLREPHVAVDIEAYRPFFILGEVAAPGQYPYVANMTAETAIAIAGGYSARADRARLGLTRNANGQMLRVRVSPNVPVRPGDTITVAERWF